MRGFLVRHQRLGQGKILSADSRTLRVQFLGEDTGELTLSASAGVLSRYVLELGRRCQAPDGECVIQSVFEAKDNRAHEYQVRFPDGVSERLSEVELLPLGESGSGGPLAELTNLAPQALALFRARERLMEALARLVQAGGGLTALLSSRIDLRSHQAYVAGCVLQDRRRRYLLADEVGLGKTIEAGIVIHDLLSQKPDARVLVICPGTLTTQWLSEMYSKFGGQTFRMLDLYKAKSLAPDSLRTAIVSTGRLLQDMGGVVSKVAWDMVVVDEAHHLLGSETLYSLVQQVSQRVPSILLLSALPARRREVELLRLLALLEPTRYSSGVARERFEALHAAQREIGRGLRLLARRITGLASGEFTPEDVASSARNLLKLPVLDKDPDLSAAVAALSAAAPDFVERALHYSHLVADRYRVNRRILRNRRQRLVERQTITAIERKLQVTHYQADPLELAATDAVLELLRGARSDGLEEEFLIPLSRVLLHSLVSPERAYTLLTALKDTARGQKLNPHGRDVVLQGHLAGMSEWDLFIELLCRAVRDRLDDEFLLRALRAVDAWKRSDARPRTQALVTLLKPIKSASPHTAKVLLFAGYPNLAGDLVKLLRDVFGVNAVAEFRAGMDREEKESNVQRFRTRQATWMMVSDESGGEGRNFQFASELVHVDTPWHVSRVEQRIGRLDRLGREKIRDDVLSHVLCPTVGVERGLLQCYDEGLRVYHTSLSGLEFALRDVEDLLVREALTPGEGEQALRALTPKLKEVASEERDRDESEAVLDEASFERDAAERYRRIQQNPEQEAELERAFLDYFRALAPGACQAANDAEFPGAVFRFSGADVPRAKRLALQTGGEAPRYEGTFRREVAQQRPSLNFFSVGHPLFDHVVSLVETEPAGRSYAVECEVPGERSWRGFHFIFQARPDLEALAESPGLQTQARALFTRRPVHIFIDENGAVVAEPEPLLHLLAGLTPQTKDLSWWNLTKEKAQALRQVFPRDWTALLNESYGIAEPRAREILRDRLDSALQSELARLMEQDRAGRQERGRDGGAGETALLIRAINGWRVVLMGAGFLSVNSAVLRSRG